MARHKKNDKAKNGANLGFVLTPGWYVGAEAVEDDAEPFDERMKRLTEKLEEQFKESAALEAQIRRNLKELNLVP